MDRDAGDAGDREVGRAWKGRALGQAAQGGKKNLGPFGEEPGPRDPFGLVRSGSSDQ